MPRPTAKLDRLPGLTTPYVLRVVQREGRRVQYILYVFRASCIRGWGIRILVDVDGVLAALLPAWIARYNRDYDDNLRVEDITHWDTSKFVKAECGKEVFSYLYDGDIYKEVEPIEGAMAGVLELRGMGHDIVYVTSCVNHSMAAGKLDWLERHGFLNHGSSVCIVLDQDKSWIAGDIMIDDYHVNLMTFEGRKILFDKPYNQEALFSRAEDWDGVVAWVRHFTKRQPA